MAEVDQEQDKKFEAGGENDLSQGPAQNRGCTDIFCVALLIAAWVLWIVVSIAGMADGDPTKLYKPRDFRGGYCDVEKNWNNGVNTKGFPKLAFTMNATSSTDLIVKQLLCSSVAKGVLTEGSVPLLATKAERDEYLCNCCLVPCKKCEGSIMAGGDITDFTKVSGVIGGKADALSGSGDVSNFVSGEFFNNMWSEATKYFNQVCLPDCNTNFATANSSSEAREWVYAMAPDNELAGVWKKLKEAKSSTNAALTALSDTIKTKFTFKALPSSLCPYGPSYCIPMPGVQFGELPNNYCSFEMAADALKLVGSAAGDTFQSLGGNAFQGQMEENFGKWVGDFQSSIDSFIVVSLLCFVIGLVYMVLLRFLVGFCVWLSVFLVFVILLICGGLTWVRSFQCSGAGIFDTSKEAAVAVSISAGSAISNINKDAPSEDMTGDGADYRGIQRFTKTGKRCTEWGTGTGIAKDYTPQNYPTSALGPAGSTTTGWAYCRNPYKAADANKAGTIWCFTSDAEVKWQECRPIGQIKPECKNGYAVTSETIRKILEVCAFIIWGLSAVYIVLVICFTNRIRLAVAVNKVAATFIAHTPHILVVPVVQALVGIIWILIWAFSAAFLISQVPDGYISKDAYHTYAEAYGTADVAGKCTDKWPTGSVWKEETPGACPIVNGTPACWKCAPPRYVFDPRFAVSFFVFLWNNALNVAIGQTVIAGAVGIWFFTPNSEKGSKNAVRGGLYNVFRYHLGSVAFGAFLVALVQFIRAILKYYEEQAKAAKNRVMVMVFKVLQCCLWCFEKCLKFLNKNAYIQIALMGTNFCTSAKKAFFLIMRNALRFGTIAILGNVIYGLGFLFIVVITLACGYGIVQAMHPQLSPAIPLLVYFFVAYVIAKLFMNVFGLAVDTSLQCFLACEEMGLGGDFVPDQMRNFLANPPSNPDEKPKDDDHL
eukprot:TRINITY_DN17289_c0_g2_i2.p1 TRINITY_DN17289_c0_g2~~TRINITY_DN17289_c0_g2_i2.p1  ORF type:complete len:939 (-),score=198.73 TRINITY_DN17289_c0_g2_i2:197-3013(-)